jgi:prepilin-type N-terminal cleavage/methylation domain-containing protein/prepilin-type processing-associated H-X9-DG protein
MKPSRTPAAFTLVELLVVIAIIVVLAGLAVPAVSGALARAKSAGCLSNLRQIGLATIGYATDNSFYLPDAGSGGSPGWAVAIQPYAGSAQNKKSVFVCPGCEIPVQNATGSEIAVTYGMHGGLMPKGQPALRLSDVDRASEVILCADMCQNPGNNGWSPYSIENPAAFKGGGRGGSGSLDTPISTGTDSDKGNSPWMRYRHAGSVNVVMCDGSARSIKKGQVLNRNAIFTD